MALGPEPIGFFYFAAVKLVGYSAAGVYLNRRYFNERRASPWLVGLVRTVIGIAAGFGAFALSAVLEDHTPLKIPFFALLVPIRMLEWMAILAIFYEKPWRYSPRVFKLSALGIAWSFILDIPAILAVFVLPGGAWIC